MPSIRTTGRKAAPSLTWAVCLATAGGAFAPSLRAQEPPGLAIYREHCVRCHGDGGRGTPEVPQPLVGDRSVNQLAAHIDETMPEEDPTLVTGEAARQVAEYIHGAFYSPVARDRNRPARVELSRLTIRQYQNIAADLIASFRDPEPANDGRRGLRGEYFRGRGFDSPTDLVYAQIDPLVDFDFRVEGPDPEQFERNRFAIRWTGSIVPPETGVYEFTIRTEHAVRLTVNSSVDEPPLIDAWVRSGDEREHKAAILLLGGRAHPLRLEFSKSNQGIDKGIHDRLVQASIQLLWKPPHGTLEPVPSRCLLPDESPEVFVLKTPFPPDDRSIGYDRGTSVSPEWFAAATAAGVEVADHAVDHVADLAHTDRDSRDRGERVRRFATEFAEGGFRRPLSADLRTLVVDRPFADAPDIDTALKRSLLLVLASPRFLFRGDAAGADGFATAARLSFALWDSIPDRPLWEAAARGQLDSPARIRAQAERMVHDRRTRAKVRDFLFAWLRVDQAPEIVKDKMRFSEFSAETVADLRTSLELFLDDVVWNPGTGSDFRRLFTDDEVYLNGRLAPLYGARLAPDAPFQRIRLDDGRRAGVLTHPYMASVLSYASATSPIHRGVFLARNVLGNVLKPPQDAVAPLAPELHPGLSTRERVALQTRAVACQTCHTLINPLGFALEEFDAIGRHRLVEKSGAGEKPVDATGWYLPRHGRKQTFRGARELAAAIATSPDAQEAFVQNLFHALAKQPVRAWGPDTLETLRRGFVANDCDIRRLLVDISTLVALPPAPAASRVTATSAATPEEKP